MWMRHGIKFQAPVVRVKSGEAAKGTDGAENAFPPVNPLLYSPSSSIYTSSMDLIDIFFKA